MIGFFLLRGKTKEELENLTELEKIFYITVMRKEQEREIERDKNYLKILALSAGIEIDV